MGMVLGAWLGAATARAEPAPEVTGALTVTELVALLRRGPELVAARARVDAARAELRSRLPWAPNPELEAELGLEPAEAEHVHAAVGLRQALPLFAEREAGREAARAAVAAAQAEADEVLRGRAIEATRALAALGRARALAAIEAEADEVAAALADAAGRREAAGEIPEDDAALLRMEATLAARAHDEARAAVARGEIAACRLIAREPCAAPPELAPVVSAPPTPEALEAVLVRRADRVAADRRVEAARAELVHARGEARVEPVVGLGFEREVDAHAGVVWRVVGTIGLELPVWDPREGLVDRHAAALAEGEAAREVVRRDATARAREAHAEWTAAALAETRMTGLAEVGRRVVDNARAAWEQGALALERVLLLRDRTFVARRALVDARWRLVEARALLELEMPL